MSLPTLTILYLDLNNRFKSHQLFQKILIFTINSFVHQLHK